MDKIYCDVLVVGAGPAGSSAARACAMQGADTIFIEKKQVVGVPVGCAEGFGSYLLSYLPDDIVIPKEQLIWKIDGIRFYGDDHLVDRRGEYWEGFTVDRAKFDQWLSGLAIQEGAKLFTGTELVGVSLDDEQRVTKVKVKVEREGEEEMFEIFPRVLIGADGVDSRVSKLTGIYSSHDNSIAEVYSWEMKNLNLDEPNMEQMFFFDHIPGGYAYIFPKSESTANIGIGGFLPKQKLEEFFYDFLKFPSVKKQVEGAEMVVEKSKKAVFGNIAKRNVHKNVILTGDAANHNLKPFIEGILPSIISGNLAGNFAHKMLNCEEVTDEQYEKEYEKIMHPFYASSRIIEDYIAKCNRENKIARHLLFFGLCSQLIDFEKIHAYEQMDYEELKTALDSNIQK